LSLTLFSSSSVISLHTHTHIHTYQHSLLHTNNYSCPSSLSLSFFPFLTRKRKMKESGSHVSLRFFSLTYHKLVRFGLHRFNIHSFLYHHHHHHHNPHHYYSDYLDLASPLVNSLFTSSSTIVSILF
jgi:hypothetical protein